MKGTAYNRVYQTSCPWHSAQILLCGISDTLGMLCKILLDMNLTKTLEIEQRRLEIKLITVENY